jgi:hexosaminidase
VQGLLQEFVPLFKTDFIHYGGDEVQDLTCWNESAAVQAFMTSKGIPDVNALRNYFQSKIQAIAANNSLSAMFWEEVYDDGYTVLPSSVIDVWLSYDEISKATAAGRRVISSFGYYLDQQDPFGASHYFWGDTWQNFFLNDCTYNASLSPAQEALILGGSLSQWGEQCDSANIASRVWPRAAGGAQRFWSAASLRDIGTEEPRLEHFRCHLVQRGIGAGPIRPSGVYGYCPLPSNSRMHRMHNF